MERIFQPFPKAFRMAAVFFAPSPNAELKLINPALELE